MDRSTATARRRADIARRLALWLFALTLPGTLGACSSVPDALNPAEWYRATKEAITGEDPDPKLEAKRAEKPAKADDAYPDLKSVPAERPEVTRARERQALQSGLVADRRQQRYSSEEIKRQGEPTSILGDPPPQAASNEPPPPVAATRSPVAQGAAAPTPTTAAQAPRPAVATTQTAPAAPVTAATGRAQTVEEAYRETLAAMNRPYSAQAPSPAAAPALDADTVVISSQGANRAPALSAAPPPSMPAGLSAAPAAAPPPVAVPRAAFGAGFQPLEAFVPGRATQSHKIATILFADGTSQLTARDKSILKQVAQFFKQQGGSLRVVGHDSGSAAVRDPERALAFTMQLSADRADRVARELTAAGVPANTLFVGAKAATDPLYAEISAATAAANRRADIYIDY